MKRTIIVVALCLMLISVFFIPNTLVSASSCNVSGPYPYTTQDGYFSYKVDVGVGTHYLSLTYIPTFKSLQSTFAPYYYNKTVDGIGDVTVLAKFRLVNHIVTFRAITQPSLMTSISVFCK